MGDLSEENGDSADGPERSKRLRLTVIICIALLAADVAIIGLIVPWVDDNYSESYGSSSLQGSLGYAITFITVLFSFLVIIGTLAYYFGRESYPSDRWQ